VQNYVSKYRHENNSSSIEQVKLFIKERLFSNKLEDDDAYFIGVNLDANGMPIIGNGSEKNHLHIHITSKALMNNLSKNGVHHVDATYKVTTYGFPLIVYGVSDAAGKFHPVSFMISSHETEEDFKIFFDDLFSEAESLDISYEPEFVMQDACPASKKAIQAHFNAKI
jgi:hypothetical protein